MEDATEKAPVRVRQQPHRGEWNLAVGEVCKAHVTHGK
jgi:hypothetical protein